MSDLLLIALVPLASLFFVLAFLLVVYLKGGKEDLKVAADAVHKVRSVGVGPAIRAAIGAMKSIKRTP
ncbi:hypothetical protein [Pseudonocardia alaniniphila]|uniref:Uncharacterized protein n=1 Tax=Pseudonocardia alaniniphila TaxID=75291 RepID=A0ABS9TA74_9PSEU|nr:hypothetical protein [Pseudonocardia alaniniphila]MCH6165323.1 hypothetical protein [Pseudonocardia alaniniphila]